MRARHRLFHVDGFSSAGSAHGVLGVRAGRSGHVDGVYLRMVDQIVGVRVGVRNAVSFGVAACLIAIAPHNGYYLRVFNPLQGGSTLHFGDIATAYNPPPHLFHRASSSHYTAWRTTCINPSP